MIYNQEKSNFEMSGKSARMFGFFNSIIEKAKSALNTIDELALVMENLDPNEPASFTLGCMIGSRKEQIDKYGA